MNIISPREPKPLSPCQARDINTCRYHGSINKMEEALSSGNTSRYLYYKEIVESQKSKVDPEEFFTVHSFASTVEIENIHHIPTLLEEHPDRLPAGAYQINVEIAKNSASRLVKHCKSTGILAEKYNSPSSVHMVLVAKNHHHLIAIQDLLVAIQNMKKEN